MRKILFILMLLIFPSISHAQGVGLLDFKQRVQLAANGSYLWFSESGPGTSNWQGSDVGGTVTYNLHQRLSVYGAYDHGFPFAESDGHLNFIRAVVNLHVYPSPGEESDNAVSIGVGRGWFGANVDDRVTNDAQVVVARKLRPRLAAFGLYAHAFGNNDVQPDFDFVKVGFTTKLYP